MENMQRKLKRVSLWTGNNKDYMTLKENLDRHSKPSTGLVYSETGFHSRTEEETVLNDPL